MSLGGGGTELAYPGAAGTIGPIPVAPTVVSGMPPAGMITGGKPCELERSVLPPSAMPAPITLGGKLPSGWGGKLGVPTPWAPTTGPSMRDSHS